MASFQFSQTAGKFHLADILSITAPANAAGDSQSLINYHNFRQAQSCKKNGI
jgi:hypothetical protein